MLDNPGNFYIVLLFLFLVGGTAVLAFNFSKKFWNSTEKLIDKSRGKLMNKWLKIAVTSFVGILMASFALGLTTGSAGQGAEAANAGDISQSGQAASHQHAGTDGTATPNNGFVDNASLYNATPVSFVQGGDNLSAQMHQLQMDMIQMQQQLGHLMQMQMSNQQMNQGMLGTGMNSGNGMNSMGTNNQGFGGSQNMNSPGAMNGQNNSGGMSSGGTGNSGGMGMM